MDNQTSKVLYRSFSGELPIMKYGVGSFLVDDKDRRYLDMSSSACTAILGHNNKCVTERILAQLEAIPNVFGGFWATDIAEQAGELLCEQMNPDWFGRVHFLNGGGEAVDLACKLAYQYHAEVGENRTSFRSLEHGFHGVGTLPFSLTGTYPRYAMMDPYHASMTNRRVLHVKHPYNVGDDAALSDLKLWLDNRVAAVIVEPVGGPPLGAYPHTKEYLQGLRDQCDKSGALLIFDEILCGSGRCGAMSVKDLYGVQPDIVLLGKGLSAGYIPMSAIVMSKKVCDRIARGSGSIMFGTAASNHTAGCAAVVGTIEYLKDNNLFASVRDKADEFADLASNALLEVAGVEAIRSSGYLLGIELRHPRTRKHLPAKLGFHAIARKHIYEEGIIVYTKGQTMDGVGDFITLAPPVEIHHSRLQDTMVLIAGALRKAYAATKGQY